MNNEIQLIIQTLTNQRNSALDQVAVLSAKLAALQEQLKEKEDVAEQS